MSEPSIKKKRRWKVAIASIQPGVSLSYDLYDDLGTLLVPTGNIVSEEVINHFVKRGINWLLIDEDAISLSPDEEISVAEQTRQYDPVAVEAVEASYDQALHLLESSLDALLDGEPVDSFTLEDSVTQFATHAEQDMAVVLSTILGKSCESNPTFTHRLLSRSIKFAALTSCVAVAMDASPNDIVAAGVAAMFHDLSLLEPQALTDMEANNGDPYTTDHYEQHPIRSSKMVGQVRGLQPLSRLLITQVHEELDGKGYPLGLNMSRIHPLARVLNITDIYLTLTEPINGQLGIIPADAMNCILYHANQGKLCVRAVRAFLESAAIYPVGSRVALENELCATVVRSCRTNLMKPAIMLDNDKESILDLRCCPIRISSPIVNDASRFGRLRASKVTEQIWRAPSGEHVVQIPLATA